MAEETQAQLPAPDPALGRLDGLVGTWRMEGHLVGSRRHHHQGPGDVPVAARRLLPGAALHHGLHGSGHREPGADRLRPRDSVVPVDGVLEPFPVPLPYRWMVDGDTMQITVSYGPLDATFTGSFEDDGQSFGGGWRPNPGADETVNVPYDVAGHRLT